MKVKDALLLERLQSDKAASLQFAFLGASLDPYRMDDKSAFLSPELSDRNCVSIGVTVNHPFSHGSIHVVSRDPLQSPRVDPAYLKDPLDLLVASAGLFVADKVFKTEPLAHKIRRRLFPPPQDDMEDREIRNNYAKSYAGTQHHPIGTAALGSVVDPSLRVLGREGLRVIDASIFPTHISGNVQATVYAIAEKAVDFIKAEMIS